MSMFDGIQKIQDDARKAKMAAALREARMKSLASRMPESLPGGGAAGVDIAMIGQSRDDKVYGAIDIGLKSWDVLTGLLDIAGALHSIPAAWVGAKVSAEAIAASEAAAQAAAAAGTMGSKVTVAFSVGEAITIAGPLVAYIGLWVGLAAPYLEIKQDYSKDRTLRGIAHGVLIGSFGHSAERARGFALRQPDSSNNMWVPGLNAAATNAYRMGFIAGYKQGRDMSQGQRQVFWKVFANTLRKDGVSLWKNDWRGDDIWDRWFLAAGIAFRKHHLTS